MNKENNSDSSSDEKKLSDPCQVPVVDPITKKKHICGHVTRSLAPHLKAHNTPSMSPKYKWNRKRYEKEFPEFSMGQKIWTPPPEQIAKLTAGRIKHTQDAAAHKADIQESLIKGDETPSKQDDDYKTWLEKRKNEIWDQVNRDVAAEVFAEEAARAEYRIKEINRRYDAAFGRGDADKCSKMMKQLIEQQEVLRKQMDFLDMNVKSRRAQGGLGNDTVAQLISNFGGTLRRWSPERLETFRNRIKEVRRIQSERIREKLLGEILEENIEEVTEHEVSEADYDEKLKQFVAKSDTV